jgi:hypothetical protein
MGRGIYPLGNFAMDIRALEHIRSEEESPSNQCRNNSIVVYGNGLNALCVLGRLEDLGIDSRRVVWVTSDDYFREIQCPDVSSI